MSKVDRVKGDRLNLVEKLEQTSAVTRGYSNVHPEIYMLSCKYHYGVRELRARIATHL